MRIDEGRQTLNLEETYEGVTLIPTVDPGRMSNWLNKNLVDLTQPISCYSYLFQLEKELSDTYKHELELIILYQILIILYSQMYYEQKKKYLFNFLVERRPVLLALDIVINIPPQKKPNV
jgi:hypothetical protein